MSRTAYCHMLHCPQSPPHFHSPWKCGGEIIFYYLFRLCYYPGSAYLATVVLMGYVLMLWRLRTFLKRSTAESYLEFKHSTFWPHFPKCSTHYCLMHTFLAVYVVFLRWCSSVRCIERVEDLLPVTGMIERACSNLQAQGFTWGAFSMIP